AVLFQKWHARMALDIRLVSNYIFSAVKRIDANRTAGVVLAQNSARVLYRGFGDLDLLFTEIANLRSRYPLDLAVLAFLVAGSDVADVTFVVTDLAHLVADCSIVSL